MTGFTAINACCRLRRVLEDLDGSFTSPGYLKNYSCNLFFEWKISEPQGRAILNFNENDNCGFDRVVVSSQMNMRLCEMLLVGYL